MINRIFNVPSQTALLAAAMAMPAFSSSVPLIKVHTIGNSLVHGSESQAREYVRDYYGYGTLPGDNSDPGDVANYNPVAFSGWRSALQFNLADHGFEVDMLGTTSSVSDLPDTILDGSLNPASFTTSDSRTYAYDPDHDGHGGWRIGGSYDLANINGRTVLRDANGGATSGFGSFVYTPGQLPISNFDAGPIDVAGFGTDVLDTGGNGLTADGANVFNRGIRDHLPEMTPSLTSANVVVLQIGINDLKNREDVEGTGSSVTERVQNGNAQMRLYNLILDIKSQVSSDTEIYVSNIATVNAAFDWDTTEDAQEAVEAFNNSFRDTYFGADFQDLAGYTDAIAEASLIADPLGLLDNVFLVNAHRQIDELIGLTPPALLDPESSAASVISPDYSQALSSDQLHWSENGYTHVGDFFADVIAQNTAVPEPTSAGLILAGAGLLIARRRRSA